MAGEDESVELRLTQLVIDPDSGKLYGLDEDGRVWVKDDEWHPVSMRRRLAQNRV